MHFLYLLIPDIMYLNVFLFIYLLPLLPLKFIATFYQYGIEYSAKKSIVYGLY